MAGKSKKHDIHLTPDVTYITNPDVSHEESDVPVGPVAKFVVALGIFGTVVCLLMLLLFNFFERRAVRGEREASPLARHGDDRLPPEPRLQLAPGFGATTEDGKRVNLSQDAARGDLKQPQPQSEYWAVRDMWRRELNQDDPANGRVPIERAKELYLQRQQQKQGGAPPQAQPSPGGTHQQGTHGQQQPAPSSSGRTAEKTHP